MLLGKINKPGSYYLQITNLWMDASVQIQQFVSQINDLQVRASGPIWIGLVQLKMEF